MQDVRYIDVKLEDGFWMAHHHSCLIDDNFINKHTKIVEELDDTKLQNSKKLEKGKSKLIRINISKVHLLVRHFCKYFFSN